MNLENRSFNKSLKIWDIPKAVEIFYILALMGDEAVKERQEEIKSLCSCQFFEYTLY